MNEDEKSNIVAKYLEAKAKLEATVASAIEAAYDFGYAAALEDLDFKKEGNE